MAAITKLTDCIAESAFDEEVVIMRIDTGEFFALSGTGAVIWGLIDGSRDSAQLQRAVADEYAVDQGKVAADVNALLGELKDAGLVAEA